MQCGCGKNYYYYLVASKFLIYYANKLQVFLIDQVKKKHWNIKKKTFNLKSFNKKLVTIKTRVWPAIILATKRIAILKERIQYEKISIGINKNNNINGDVGTKRLRNFKLLYQKTSDQQKYVVIFEILNKYSMIFRPKSIPSLFSYSAKSQILIYEERLKYTGKKTKVNKNKHPIL